MRKKAKKGVMYFIGIVCQLQTDIETDTIPQYFLLLNRIQCTKILKMCNLGKSQLNSQCLPQRLKSIFFEKISNGVAPKRPAGEDQRDLQSVEIFSKNHAFDVIDQTLIHSLFIFPFGNKIIKKLCSLTYRMYIIY